MYPECFNSRVGCFEDDTYHITLDLQVPAVVHAPCKVPVEVKDKLWAELHELESRDIIARVTQPTDWLNVLVIRKEKMGDFVYASILKTWTRRSAENAIRSYRRGNNTQVNRCKALQQAQRSKGLLECKIRQKIIFNNLQYAIRQVPLPLDAVWCTNESGYIPIQDWRDIPWMWGSHRHCRWHYRLREEWQRTRLPPTWNHRAYQESWHQAQSWEACYQDKGVQFLRHALHTRWGQAKPRQSPSHKKPGTTQR